MTAHEFHEFLTQLRFGELHNELTEALQDVTVACQETGKVGEITLSIKLKPGKGGQIEIVDTLKTKVPTLDHGTTLMFSTPDGFLQRDDPRQTTMDLKVVEPDRAEPRRVS